MAGADRNNPRDYWEPRASLNLNNTILRRRGSAVYDTSLRLQEDGAFDAQEKGRVHHQERGVSQHVARGLCGI
jgi:hypothetical protein